MRSPLRWLALVALAEAGLVAGVSSAQEQATSVPYRWSSVVVGAGGYAPNVVFSPAERGLVYLRTDMGGAYRRDARSLRWVPLQDGNPVSSYMGIESIAPDPVNPDIVYLAAGMNAASPAAILRSTDRGTTWTVVSVPFAMGGNEPGRGLGERLAVDPNDTRRLFFGSRHDGLWRSLDNGLHWTKVDAFPHGGLGMPVRGGSNGGVSFVAIDPGSGKRGKASQRVWAGVADPSGASLYRSDDGGTTWQAAPGPNLFATKGVFDAKGALWVGFSDGIGPSDAKTGAVWRYDRTGTARDVTPPSWRAAGAEGGFLGIAIAASRPGMAAVSTIDRYRSGDSLWVTRDDGRSWDDVGPRSRRDVTATPFLRHEGKGADFGHWISGLAIDPFDARHVLYTTGATLYATRDIDAREAVRWAPWVDGIEQTAIITAISPTKGAPLISGFGDLAGFVHDDLAKSPEPSFIHPYLSNTNTLDYAGLAPHVIVRSGSLYVDRPRDASLGRSDDGGRHWTPIKVPGNEQPAGRDDLNGEAPVTVAADGGAMIVGTLVPQMTRDRGRNWQTVRGLPGRTRAVADRVDPARFYAVDVAAGQVLVSDDGGTSFSRADGRGLPSDLTPMGRRGREAQSALFAVPGSRGELWLQAGGRLYHSTDGAASFVRAVGELKIELFGLGHQGVLFAAGTLGEMRGIWRSSDGGTTWQRIDDDAHRWGGRYRVIVGDPRKPGRVYVGTDGRGV